MKWDDAGDLDTDLTVQGKEEARLVGSRLASAKVHLAISSHLARARDTALAILEHHSHLDLEQWQVVKERCFGHLLEGNLDLIKAQSIVEDAVHDRDLLTWRPPGGESIVDLQQRARDFLAQVQERAVTLPETCPTILVATHGGFMAELYRVLVKPKVYSKPKLRNTAIDQYRISLKINDTGKIELDKAVLELDGCAKHLG